MTTVAAFLQDQANVPFQLGVSDCCLFVADYVLAVDGVDHASDLRGTYSTQAGAHRVMTKLGGLQEIMNRSGWARSDVVADGSIAIIGDNPLLPAICEGGGFYFKSGTGGVAYISTPPVGPVWARPA